MSPESTPVVDVNQVRSELQKLLRDNSNYGFYDSSDPRVVNRWLNHSTDNQLLALESAIRFARGTHHSPAEIRESKVIRFIIYETLNSGVLLKHTHGLLEARAAFCGARSIFNDAMLNVITTLYAGLTSDAQGKPLPENKVIPLPQLKVVLRYIYEVTTDAISHRIGFPMPVEEIYVSEVIEGGYVSRTYSMLQCKNTELIKVVLANHDRLESLIDLSISNRTTDPVRLAVLLEYEGHSTLSSGAL